MLMLSKAFSSRVLRGVFDHSDAHKPSQSSAKPRTLHLRYSDASENRTSDALKTFGAVIVGIGSVARFKHHGKEAVEHSLGIVLFCQP